ncbi:hypothetical protein E4U09_007999 [Claviceps aff. purpurea]|uniref:Uncharacterized protein n=1 Tax=Claviceps aff. purpurea TaxID=1967640 RepID=A0A9P7QPC2_9HYPO|nr:hypothetical protein E4U09_007999 [Claviceps aff. purpurea]
MRWDDELIPWEEFKRVDELRRKIDPFDQAPNLPELLSTKEGREIVRRIDEWGDTLTLDSGESYSRSKLSGLDFFGEPRVEPVAWTDYVLVMHAYRVAALLTWIIPYWIYLRLVLGARSWAKYIILAGALAFMVHFNLFPPGMLAEPEYDDQDWREDWQKHDWEREVVDVPVMGGDWIWNWAWQGSLQPLCLAAIPILYRSAHILIRGFCRLPSLFERLLRLVGLLLLLLFRGLLLLGRGLRLLGRVLRKLDVLSKLRGLRNFCLRALRKLVEIAFRKGVQTCDAVNAAYGVQYTPQSGLREFLYRRRMAQEELKRLDCNIDNLEYDWDRRTARRPRMTYCEPECSSRDMYYSGEKYEAARLQRALQAERRLSAARFTPRFEGDAERVYWGTGRGRPGYMPQMSKLRVSYDRASEADEEYCDQCKARCKERMDWRIRARGRGH